MISIRPAGTSDSDVIWSILRPIFRAGQTYAIDPKISQQQAMAYWMAGHAFLAESQTGPVGTFYIQENRAGGGAHYCNCGFATDPAATGQGVARQMLDYALQTATSLGFEGMVFNFVVSSNTRAVALWQKNGFEIVGTVPDAFRVHGSQDADALVMFRAL